MTLTERLEKAERQSVTTYQARTDVQMQIQQLQMRAGSLDQELLRLDGEIRVLQALASESAGGA